MQHRLRLVDSAQMSSPSIIPPDGSPPYSPAIASAHTPKWGTPIQLATFGVSVLALMLGPGMAIYFHMQDKNVKDTETQKAVADTHTNDLIDRKLSPVVSQINIHTDALVGALDQKVQALAVKVGNLYGLNGKVTNLEVKTNRIESVARVDSPSRIMAVIQGEIELAQKSEKPLSPTTLIDYKNAIQALPQNAAQYWTTTASIINYVSFLNQKFGKAPDPEKVSAPCMGITNTANFRSRDNFMMGEIFRNCIVDLETATFVNVTFINSVVRYSGGAVNMRNVRLVNCRFVVNIPHDTPPANPKFMLALLNSDQNSLSVSTN
jgi:hypothetical protein